MFAADTWQELASCDEQLHTATANKRTRLASLTEAVKSRAGMSSSSCRANGVGSDWRGSRTLIGAPSRINAGVGVRKSANGDETER